MKHTIRFLFDHSLFLIMGALGGLTWANISPGSYEQFLHFEFFRTGAIGDPHMGADGTPEYFSFTFHFLVNDLLMALFFAIAGKEVWEATFPGGPLSNAKTAATPLIATIGGMAGPAALYIVGAIMLGEYDHLHHGWAVPCATDIAFSYMVARLVFGSGHPAIPFLLLLAIADDALGLIIIAVFYPTAPVQPIFLLLCLVAMAICYVFKRSRKVSYWPYLLVGGTISWLGFALAGLHPALGFLPIIPMMPHAHVDEGLFNWRELKKPDTLNQFEHAMKNPVEIILGLFGLMNAGVAFSSFGNATWLVLIGLLVGKPLGIWLFGWVGASVFKFGLPKGMNYRDLFVLGCAAGIGFTVALFVAAVAFKGHAASDAAKMGALGSFSAVIVTVAAAKILGIRKVEGPPPGHGH